MFIQFGNFIQFRSIYKVKHNINSTKQYSFRIISFPAYTISFYYYSIYFLTLQAFTKEIVP